MFNEDLWYLLIYFNWNNYLVLLVRISRYHINRKVVTYHPEGIQKNNSPDTTNNYYYKVLVNKSPLKYMYCNEMRRNTGVENQH